MKKRDLIKALERYDDDTEINFFLIPNDGSEEDGDENDKEIKFVGEIYTGQLEDDNIVDVGFQEPKPE